MNSSEGPPYQVLDDKIFICHIGLSIHSERGILVEYRPETLGSKDHFLDLRQDYTYL